MFLLLPSHSRSTVKYPVLSVCITGCWVAGVLVSTSFAQGRPRFSEHISAAIRAGVPAYSPVAAPTAPASAPGTIEMDPFVVEEDEIKAPTEKESQTKDALAQSLRKRYPGASLKGQDPVQSVIPNYAATMYRDDERLAKLSHLQGVATSLRATGDPGAAKALKRELQRTFIRRPDAMTESMDRAVNSWRN
jgi:hypothetical protein